MKINKSIIVSAIMAALVNPVMADEKVASQKIEGDLSVMVLGSGGPVAHQEGRASAGYLIYTDGSPRILMDVGGGTYQRLAKSGQNIKDLEIVLLSHLHADHTGDLTSVMKSIYFHNNLARTAASQKGIILPGRKNPINIWGPGETTLSAGPGVTYPTGYPVYPSTEDYVHDHYSVGRNGVERYLTAFVLGISDDDGPGNIPGGGPGVPVSKFAYTANDLNSRFQNASQESVIDCAGIDSTKTYCVADAGLDDADKLLVTAIAVDHGPVPAVAYRVEYKGHSVVYSGDTGTKGGGHGLHNMINISQDADLLIYDTAVMEADGPPGNPLFHLLHTQPSLIANVALNADVDKLVLSHLTPVTSSRVGEIKKIIKDSGYTGKIKVAKDLKVYNLGDDD